MEYKLIRPVFKDYPFPMAEGAVSGPFNYVPTFSHFELTFFGYIYLIFFFLSFFAVIGAVLAIISSRYETRTLKCFAFSIYSLGLLCTAILFLCLFLLGLFFFLIGAYFYGALCLLAFFCASVIGYRYKELKTSLSALTHVLPLTIVLLCGGFLIMLEGRNAFSFFGYMALYFMIPILLALYYRRFQDRDIPLRPLFIFVGGAFSIVIFPFFSGLALEYFEVIS